MGEDRTSSLCSPLVCEAQLGCFLRKCRWWCSASAELSAWGGWCPAGTQVWGAGGPAYSLPGDPGHSPTCRKHTGYWGGGPKEGSLATWHLEQGTPLCLLLSCFLRVLSWMHSTLSVPFKLYPSCKQHRECAHPTLPATGLFTGPKPTFPAGSWQHGRTKASWIFHVSLLSYCVELEVIALRRHSTNQSLLSHFPWEGFSLLRALRWPSVAGAGQHGWRRYVEA